MRKLNHSDVLAEIEKNVKKPDVKSIQIKEKECIVTLASLEAKNKLIIGTSNIQNQHITFYDVDSILTNVTIKDAPYEMADSTLIAHLSQYGEILSGSIARGKIKGSDIENGTRYVKILNCVPVLPLKDDIGRFTIRMFADNNRTPCRYCGDTSHPYFKCMEKPSETMNKIRCWNCKGPHAKKDCDKGTICHFCEQEGHMSHECPVQLYGGEYADDIIENQAQDQNTGSTLSGTSALEQSSVSMCLSDDETNHENTRTNTDNTDNTESRCSNTEADHAINSGKSDVFPVNTETEQILLNDAKLIIGDSNVNRMRITDDKIKNLSVSGAKFSDVKHMISAETENNVDSICIHLGTNDLKNVGRDEIVQNALGAIDCVQKKWPMCEIAFSSIIPRLGKSRSIQNFNANSKFVNEAILNNCLTTKTYHYIDNDEIFSEKGTIVKSLYDARDPSGIHVNDEGARKLYKNLVAFLEGGISDEDEMQAPRNKRLRSNDSTTSSSDSQSSKQVKTD